MYILVTIFSFCVSFYLANVIPNGSDDEKFYIFMFLIFVLSIFPHRQIIFLHLQDLNLFNKHFLQSNVSTMINFCLLSFWTFKVHSKKKSCGVTNNTKK